jgi:N-acetylmuramoyl-L-alanine amidase CwlA
MQINKRLTKVNYKKGNNRSIKYIVIHYVGATGGAEDNCKYFERFYRAASAHYFVGHYGEVWQCVEEKDISWGVGATKYKHKDCRNSNCINVEMCCRKDGNGNWYFEPKTIAATIDLVKELMKKYGIPVANVLRHYDVTGKHCPAPYVKEPKDWENFKSKLVDKAQPQPAKPVVKKKSNEEIAREVIRGNWGNGAARKKRLTAAGYNYSEVQSIVNRLLK